MARNTVYCCAGQSLSAWHKARATWEDGLWIELTTSEWAVGMFVGAFSLLMTDWEGSVPLRVVPSLGRRSWDAEEPDQASQWECSSGFLPLPSLQLLTWLPSVMNYYCNLWAKSTLSSPSCFCLGVYHKNRKQANATDCTESPNELTEYLKRCAIC